MTVRQGFFDEGDFTDVVGRVTSLPLAAARQPACGKCGLHKTCLTPKMPVAGKGKLGILVCAESPGKHEDEQGRPLVGASGRLLRDQLDRCGADLDNDCWATNSAACRPEGNKLPEHAVDHCRPLVLKAIYQHNPSVILLLGGSAVSSVIGWLWKDSAGGIAHWAGWKIPSRRLNCWIVPTYHPSYLLRQGAGKGEVEPAEALFRTHVQSAVELARQGRPYGEQGAPDLEEGVKILMDDAEAAHYLHRAIDAGKPISFDYETDRLKPDHKDARIVCAAVCDGWRSFAFPWYGKAIRAMSELLRSDVPKIGWSLSFEERWTQRVLGHGVNGWAIDGMLAAHVLDNRRGTKSLKFQAFVRLGADSYDERIKPFMKADSGNLQNQISRVNLHELLKYNGIDARLEWELGHMMAKELGISLEK